MNVPPSIRYIEVRFGVDLGTEKVQPLYLQTAEVFF